jgi:hypothetical protein
MSLSKNEIFNCMFQKDSVRNSICHTSTVICNSFMHCGTTSDQFLRDNLDWLSRATNWAKFTATASLGVIHKVRKAFRTLQIQNILNFVFKPKGTRKRSSHFDVIILTKRFIKQFTLFRWRWPVCTWTHTCQPWR